jgi:Smr domain
MSAQIKVVNLEQGLPTRDEACQKLEVVMKNAARDGVSVLKVIHGYGSSGVGGVLRFAIRNFLRRKKDAGQVAIFVNGESFSSFDARTKTLLTKCPQLLLDPDLGRANKGITLVLL